MISTELLKGLFNDRITLVERRPGLYQLFLPLYHEDGDMINVYLQELPDGKIRICDLASTLMRLSYTFELNTPARERIFQRILSENRVTENNGNLFIDSPVANLIPSILALTQAVLKVSYMQLYKREIVESLFYEQLAEFIQSELSKYKPQQSTYPIAGRDDLEVDWAFLVAPRPIYLFGIKDSAKARLSTIACQAFVIGQIPFKSFMVHEDIGKLSHKDLARITSVATKQFPSLEDFRANAVPFIEVEAA